MFPCELVYVLIRAFSIQIQNNESKLRPPEQMSSGRSRKAVAIEQSLLSLHGAPS